MDTALNKRVRRKMTMSFSAWGPSRDRLPCDGLLVSANKRHSQKEGTRASCMGPWSLFCCLTSLGTEGSREEAPLSFRVLTAIGALVYGGIIMH